MNNIKFILRLLCNPEDNQKLQIVYINNMRVVCMCYIYIYIYIIKKLFLFSVRALIKYMFWIIRVSQLPVQPLPTITSDNGE